LLLAVVPTFTKTANLLGRGQQQQGTNTNRIVKPAGSPIGLRLTGC
jgi:hypothetical protein